MNKTTLKRTAICSALLSAVVMVAGCNDDDNSSSNNSGQQQTTTEKLTGTAATGAALAGANVEVVNKNGTTKSVVAGADGKFSIDVEKGAPYLLKATKGTGESQVTLYSYASAAGNVNVTQLTTQAILAANKADEKRDYNSLAEIYTNWAKLTKDSGLDGVVCSAQEAKMLREALGSEFALVTPGIRPEGSSADDQKRIVTPKQAMLDGATHLVIGRPITQSANPCQMLKDILATF